MAPGVLSGSLPRSPPGFAERICDYSPPSGVHKSMSKAKNSYRRAVAKIADTSLSCDSKNKTIQQLDSI